MWRLFGPKRTPLSVIEELVEGFDRGTVVFPWSEVEMAEVEEPALILDIAPVADGPFLHYPSTTFGTARTRKRRTSGGVVRDPGVLVDSESAGEVSGYASV